MFDITASDIEDHLAQLLNTKASHVERGNEVLAAQCDRSIYLIKGLVERIEQLATSSTRFGEEL